MIRKQLFVSGLIAVVLVIAQAAVQAQDPPGGTAEPVTPQAPAEQAPVAFPVAEISGQADGATSRLSQIRSDLKSSKVVEEVSASLEGLVETLDRLQANPASQDPSTLTMSKLTELHQRWRRYQTELDATRAKIEQASRELESRSAELKAMQVHWEATEEAAAGSDIPEAVADRIDSILMEIHETEILVRERLDAGLTLQAKLSQDREVVTDTLVRIDSAETALRKALFRPDAPPLWRAFSAAEAPGESLLSQIRNNWQNDRRVIRDFLGDYPERTGAVGLVFLVLVVLLVYVRQRVREWVEGEPKLENTRRVLDKPVSAAALLALLTAAWIYPDAPALVYELLLMLAIVPILRIVPGVVSSWMHRPLYALAVLFVLETVDDIFVDAPLLHRLMLIVLTTLGLVGTLWTLRLGDRELEKPAPRSWSWAVLVGRLVAIDFAFSLVMNVVGNVEVATMLTDGILDVAFIAVVLFVGVILVENTLVVLLRIPGASVLRMIRLHRDLIQKRASNWIRAGALIWWIYASLGLFRMRIPVIEGLSAFFGMSFQLGSLEISVGAILSFCVALWIATLISRLLRFVLEEDVMPRLGVPRGTSATVSMLVNYAVLSLGFLGAVVAGGVELSQFAIVAGALGVGIGFGLQNVVNNFISGLILAFERPIQVGDTIQFGERMGQVRRIGIRASVVRTFDGAEVIVPNGNLISAEVINWTLSDRLRRVEIPVGVAYGTDPATVLELLIGVAKGDRNAMEFPEPYALFVGFGESSLDFVLRFWTNDFDNWRIVASEVTVQIASALKQAGIEIPFPQRDLHVRSIHTDLSGVPGKVPSEAASGED